MSEDGNALCARLKVLAGAPTLIIKAHTTLSLSRVRIIKIKCYQCGATLITDEIY